MPAPASVDELLELVHKSGVADEAKLNAYLARMAEQGTRPPEPNKVAGLLVRDGLLTYFQAEQLLQGKWKRFSIGKYKVLEKLGAGGMGSVFLCEHKLMRRRVAVKVLPTAKAADEASLNRFYREARAVAAVDHPNLVRAYDIDQDDNLHFLVMEYVDGTNLQDLIKKFGPLDVVRACHYIYGSAVGLQHAHEMGLVHRDIKPGNILLDRSGVIKILDLGLARFFHDTEDNLTKQYDENILGTADYLSPEQAEDSHEVDIRADIYSLGATFYYTLTGSQPFPEGTIPQKLIWHKSREPRPIKSYRADVPDEVVAIVAKMMAKNPDDRYRTPAELMAALAPWASTPIPPPSEREMPQLSPAVLGGMGRGHGPAAASLRTMVGASGAIPLVAGSGSGSGVRVSVSPSMGDAPTVAGGGAPTPSGLADGSARTFPTVTQSGTGPSAATGNGVWETLEESPVAGKEDTARPRRPSTEPKTRPAYQATADRKKPRPLLLLIGGGILLVGLLLVVGAYLFSLNKRDDERPQPTSTGKRLFVSKSNAGAENTFASLERALRVAGAGDTIVLNDPTYSETALKLAGRRDVTVESGLPGGKVATIEFSSGGGGGTVAMLDVSSTENIRFKDIEFNGGGVADFGINVSGLNPGLTFDGITVRGVKKAGFRLYNAAGADHRPLSLQKVRVFVTQATEIGVKVEAAGTIASKWLAIRNSRFEGSNRVGTGIRFDGPVSNAELTGNRFSRLDAAFALGGAPAGQPVHLQIAQNTIFEARVGILFTPSEAKLDVAINRNYFANTPALAQVDGGVATGVTSVENGHDPLSRQGSVALAATKFDSPLLAQPNPDDDAAFLRFPAGSGPSIGPGAIGAN